MTGTFLLEIGTEEIPARFVANALGDIKSLLERKLTELRLGWKTVRVMGTPRRLMACVEGLALRQEDEEKTVYGPPRQAAYDAEGKPTKAAEGFARARGVSVDQLKLAETPKGEVLCLQVRNKGRGTMELLAEVLPGFITSLPFPKSMRWGESALSFARPIHWLLALLDGEVIPFSLDSTNSSNETRGHRFMSSGSIAVKGEKDFLKKLEKAHVIIDPEIRAEMLKREIKDAASKAGGHILPDEPLVHENTYLTEYPTAVCGNFDADYLKLPRPVLITAMREHQRYFAVVDERDTLLPHFVAVNNTLARDPEVVRKGHERVLRARLEDARFFYEEDSKRPLMEHAERLKSVLFQAKLGTSYEKMERFREIAASIAQSIRPALVEDVRRCALLCKADLVTEMVGEFPSLQGVMGSFYARTRGEKKEVAEAIEEHYLPRFSGDSLPAGDIGALVGLADRLDTIVGCFGVGLIPTGAADPYALRRHTLAIINILLEKEYDLSLPSLVSECIRLLGSRVERPADTVLEEVLDFFRVRLRGIMTERGFSYDVVDAVLSLPMGSIPDMVKRVEILGKWRKEPEFETQAATFKRVFNIIKAQPTGTDIDSGVFQTLEEAQLLGAYQTAEREVAEAFGRKDYGRALSLFFDLKEPIDAFFNAVMVMDQDLQVRANRLNLLGLLAGMFRSFADFSRLEM